MIRRLVAAFGVGAALLFPAVLMAQTASDKDITTIVLGTIVALTVIVGFFLKIRTDVDAAAKAREEEFWKRVEKVLHDARDSIQQRIGSVDAHQIQLMSRTDSALAEIKSEIKEVRSSGAKADRLEERLQGYIQLSDERHEAMLHTLERIESALPQARDFMAVIKAFAERPTQKDVA